MTKEEAVLDSGNHSDLINESFKFPNGEIFTVKSIGIWHIDNKWEVHAFYNRPNEPLLDSINVQHVYTYKHL